MMARDKSDRPHEAINLSLPAEVVDALRSLAEEQDRPVSRVAAQLLRSALQLCERDGNSSRGPEFYLKNLGQQRKRRVHE